MPCADGGRHITLPPQRSCTAGSRADVKKLRARASIDLSYVSFKTGRRGNLTRSVPEILRGFQFSELTPADEGSMDLTDTGTGRP